jgi:hypothetical protein
MPFKETNEGAGQLLKTTLPTQGPDEPFVGLEAFYIRVLVDARPPFVEFG